LLDARLHPEQEGGPLSAVRGRIYTPFLGAVCSGRTFPCWQWT